MYDPRWDDPRERERSDDGRRACTTSVTGTTDDPRDGLMHDLDLPRGDERELVVDRDRVYELNGEDSRTLAAVGTFRVVPEHDLGHRTTTTRSTTCATRACRTSSLGDDERGVVLTKEGRDLLDSHTLERDDEAPQAFHAGVNRPRELDHDAHLYATYRQEEARLRDEHGDLDIRRVVLEQDLKREYQEFLQDAQPQPLRQRRPTGPRRGGNPRLGARTRPAVLRRPGPLPRLPHRVRGRRTRAPRGRRAVHAALPRRPRRQPRQDRLPHLRRRIPRRRRSFRAASACRGGIPVTRRIPAQPDVRQRQRQPGDGPSLTSASRDGSVSSS